MVASEPVCIFRREPFHERSGGVHFFRGVCIFERFLGKEKIGEVTPRLRSNFRCEKFVNNSLYLLLAVEKFVDL